MAGTRFKVQDIASGSPTVTTKLIVSGAGRLYGIFINTVLSAHAVTVVNRRTATSPQVQTTMATIPASAAAGSQYRFEGVEFDDNLYLVTNAAATGNVTVQYQPRFKQT